MIRILLIALLTSVLTACSIPAPTATPEPTETPTAIPTDTPVPEPTPEPTPTVEEVSFQVWSADDVLAAFDSHGVELGEVRPMTRDDFGPAPYVAVEAMRFLVPSLGEGRGGRLLIFDEQEDLDITRHYYVELGEAGTMFFSHVFSRDNVLIQINGDMPDEQAATYEAALLAME